jgi:hypothetical protein
MKATYTLVALFLVGLSTDPARADEETVVFDFSGGTGKPHVVRHSGDELDGRKPLTLGNEVLKPGEVKTAAVFRLGPGDRVRLNVTGDTSFTGKTLDFTAELVKIKERKESAGFLGLGSRTVRERHPTRQPLNPDTQLKVGVQVRVYLWVYYLNGGKAGPYEATGAKGVDLRLGRPADVLVELKYPDGDVVWADRAPKADEKSRMERLVEDERKKGGYDEAALVNAPAPQVRKGDLGKLKVTVTAERP